MKILIAAVLLFALMACASCEVPPGVPTTVYGIAYGSDGNPVGPGKTVDVYVDGQLYQSVKTIQGATSDSVYVLTFGEGNVGSSDTLTFKIDGAATGDSITFGSLGDLKSLNLRAESGGNGNGGSHGSSGGSSGTGAVGTIVGGTQLPPPQTNPQGGSGQNGAANNGGNGQPVVGDGANGGQQKVIGNAGTGPTGAAVGGSDSTWLMGLGVLAIVVVAFLFVKGKGPKKGRFSIQ